MGSMVSRIIALLTLVCISKTFPVTSQAAPPFVAGFERFGRHEDIDAVASGRLLLSELSCIACHTSDDKTLQPKGGPNLVHAGRELRREWVIQFLADPQLAKPGTTMPNLLNRFDASERSEVVDALAAFIASLEKPFSEVKASGLVPVPHEFWSKGNVEAGRELYHQVGCVACHEPDATYTAAAISDSHIEKLLEQLGPDEIEDMGLGAAARRVDSIPHGDLPRKYTPQGLTMFLLDPLQFRASGNMPSFKLLPTEAADLSAYLLAKGDPAPRVSFVANSSLVQTGREWFVKLNCNQCHETGEPIAKNSFKPLAELSTSAKQSCLSGEDRSLDFSLDQAQTTAMSAALAGLNTTPDANSTLKHTMLQMNCFACHERDELGGVGRNRKPYFETVGSVDLGDEGRLPPPLTGAGRKLQPGWFKKVLLGEKADIRPYMLIRMPVFPMHVAETVSTQMAVADEATISNEEDTFESLKDLPSLGRTVMDVGCVQCHKFRGSALPGVVGVDLKGVTQRVRPDWFRSFILDPGSLKARTRMPTFFPDGKSQLPAETYGDVDHQVSAIWSYLKELDKEPLPEKVLLANSKTYELEPTERPIILRTFMPDAGTHAIAVGFPDGINFAFDAEKMRLATIWRGRFLDAQGTWYVRSAPPASPLGKRVVQLPALVPFVFCEDIPKSWPTTNDGYKFKGYRLDSKGIPTFLYSFEEFDFEDRIFPGSYNRLFRTIQVKSNQVKSNQAKSKSVKPRLAWLATQKVLTKEQSVVILSNSRTNVVPIAENQTMAQEVYLSHGLQLSLSYQW